jgi:hypothetical protein
MVKRRNGKLSVETLRHDEATRTNIPTAEFQSVMTNEQKAPVGVRYSRGRATCSSSSASRTSTCSATPTTGSA